MVKIVWKNFKYNWKNFVAFFSCISISIMVLFVFAYAEQAAEGIKKIPTQVLEFAYRSELQKEFRMILPVIMLITILMVAYSIRFYIQSRMRDYGIFQILGICKNKMCKMILIEYALGCSVSVLAGLILGKIMTMFLGKFLEYKISKAFIQIISMKKVYVFSLILAVVMIIGTFFAIYITIDSKGIDGMTRKNVTKEKRLTFKRAIVWELLGIIFIGIGYFMIFTDAMMAYVALILICIGIVIGINVGIGPVMERLKSTEYYKRNIVKWNHTYHYCKKHSFRLLMQTVLGIIVVWLMFFMVRSNSHDRLMPNDFVCMAEQGNEKEVMEQMRVKYHAEEKIFPFIWVNEIASDSWIGIRVSDYNRYYDKNIELKNDEVVRILREEGSKESELDHTGKEKWESIDLGKCANMDESEAIYNKTFIIKNEQIKEVLGFSMTGMVVLPDKVFETAVKEKKFHQIVMIMNVPLRYEKKAAKYITVERNKGILSEAFLKQEFEEIDKENAILSNILVVVASITVLFMTLFIIGLQLWKESEEETKEYEYFKILGGKSRQLCRLMSTELCREIWIALVCTIIISGTFLNIFIHAYYGDAMSVLGEKETDLKLLMIVLLGYSIVQITFFILSKIRIIRYFKNYV